MINYNNVRIFSVDIEKEYYDHKKEKHIKHKVPKIRKKLMFEDDVYDLGELFVQIKNCHDRDPYRKMEVSFTSEMDY